MAKRANQVQRMLEITNRMLKANRVIDEWDTDVMFFQHLLLETRTYKGFNWFYDVILRNDEEVVVTKLAGTSDHDKLRDLDAYIQFY